LKTKLPDRAHQADLPTGQGRRKDNADMTSIDGIRRSRDRDKLTIAEICADLDISRRTFYEWRAKNRAPKCITLPNGSLRIRRIEYQRWLASRETG
jgi:predicted DNA-binding transcriptional regulator AlpA